MNAKTFFVVPAFTLALASMTHCGPKDGDGTKPRIASLKSKDWKSRVDKIDVLAESRSVRSLALIARSLTDPHPRVREAAVKALARREDKSVIPELAKVVKDPDEGVRLAAIAALQRFTGARAMSLVLLRLGSGSHKERQTVVNAIADQLRRCKPAGRAAALKQLVIIVKAERPENQVDAAAVLQFVGALAAPAVLDGLAAARPGSGGTWVARLQTALARMGKPAVYPLVSALRFAHKRGHRARAAVPALVGIGAPAVPALIETLDFRKQYSHDAADLARKALVQIGAKAVPGIVAKLLKNKAADLRLLGVELLQRIRSAQAAPALIAMIKAEPDRTVRLAAIRALGLSRDRSGAAVILASLHKDAGDKGASERRWAAYREALVALQVDAKTVQPMLTAAEPQVRLVGTQVAGSLKLAATASALPALLKDKKPMVVQAAAWATGRLQAKGALKNLRRLLYHRNHAIRLHAVVSVGQLGGRRAAGDLVGAARFRKSAAVRAAALLALGRLNLRAGLKAAKKNRHKYARILRTIGRWTYARLRNKPSSQENPTLVGLLRARQEECAKKNPEGDAFVDLTDIYRFGDAWRLERVITAGRCKQFQGALKKLALTKGSETFTVWWDSDKKVKREEVSFEAGVRQGVFQRWHKNGKPETHGYWLAGLRHHRWKTWWDNGRRRSRGRFFNGRKRGNWMWWFATGTPMETGAYKEGRKNGTWLDYHPNGKKARELKYVNGVLQGPQVSYYPNGQKSGEAIFKDGKRQGAWHTFYPTGKKRSQGQYLNGLRHGAWTWFHPNGKERETGTFDKGEKTGTWKVWNNAGEVVERCEYTASGPKCRK